MRGAFNRLAGALLIVAAVACWAALLTWSIDDPTLTRSGAGMTGNLLGAPGAAISDILFRCLGLASAFTLLPLAFWGGSLLLRQRVTRWRVKFMLWVAGTLGVAGAFASVPTIQAWRIPHGFGGLTGDFVYALAGNIMGYVSAGHGAALAAVVLLAGGASALFASLGAGREELGMILHGDAWSSAKRPAPSMAPHPASWPQAPLVAPPSARTSHYVQPLAASSLVDMARGLWRHRPGRAERSAMRRMLDRATGVPQPLRDGGSPYQPVRPPAAAVMPGAQAPSVASFPADAMNDAAIAAALEAESRAIAARFAPRGGAAPVAAPGIDTRPHFAAPVQGELPLWRPDASAMHPAVHPAAAAAPPHVAPPTATATRARDGMRSSKGRAAQRQAGQAYRPPVLTLLKRVAAAKPGPEYSQNVQRGVAKLLEDVLIDFGIKGQIQAVKPGPVVTLYELEPARGIKSSRIVGLSDDIARSMSATSARVAGIPGRNVIGIELPNMRRETVFLRELLESETYQAGQSTLPMVLGKGIGGEPIVADLARMPHVLVAGTTGSGKSVGINAMILSLLYRLGPEQCRFLMIDPKMLELSVYNGIPHLLTPVITEPHKAVAALNWVVREMEERYKRMAQLAVRNIEVFNGRVRQAAEQGEELARTVQTGFDPVTGEPVYETERMQLEAMPYIVVVVDEMADLMLTAGKEIEGAVQRLAQMARAAGIHLIMATQRPSVDVITGTIKANFPTRISFKVTSKIDSRTILGEQGAEQLLGAGDMLFSTGTGQIVRVHGPFVADEEVEQIAAYLRTLGEPAYVDGIGEDAEAPDAFTDDVARDESEDIYDKAVAVVLRDRKASTSYIQRRLSIGYNRAADIMERMEREGLVSAANSVGKRNILVGEAKAS